MLLGPLARFPGPEGCPASSGLLLATRRVGWAGPRQKRLLCARLVEVREALTQIRRKQALQDSERKGTEQEAIFRWAPLSSLLRGWFRTCCVWPCGSH